MSREVEIDEEGQQAYVYEATPSAMGRLQEIVVELTTTTDCMNKESEDSFKGPVARAVERLLKAGIVALADPRGHWIDLYETIPYPKLVMEYRSDDGSYRADEPKRITLKVPRVYVKAKR